MMTGRKKKIESLFIFAAIATVSADESTKLKVQTLRISSTEDLHEKCVIPSLTSDFVK